MDTINVLIAAKLEKVYQRQIAEVDRRIKVYDVDDLIRAELQWTPGIVVSAEERKKLDGLLREAEILFLSRPPTGRPPQAPTLLDFLSRAPNLKWVQFQGTGVDSLAKLGLLESNIILTNASGVTALPIAEYVLCVMLMFAKKALLCFQNMQKKLWNRYTSEELRGKTLGIISLGSIGQEVARLAKPFGMRVVATRRSVVRKQSDIMEVDMVYPCHDLLEMLAECDFVVLAVPLTKETERMIGEPELKAMKPGSYLINVARGRVLDEAMLIRALKEGWIAGAGLEALEKEPLPPESELWEIPNVIIVPHVAGITPMHRARVIDLFCGNLKRYINGQPLLNVVDKEKGY